MSKLLNESSAQSESPFIAGRAQSSGPARANYTIMLAGLYAELFRRFPTPATLTRWADLEEEISDL